MSDSRDWRSGDEPPPADDRRPLPPHLDPRGARPPGQARAGLPPRPVPPRPGGRPPSQVVVPAKPRRRRLARVLSWIAVVMSVTVLVGATGVYVLVQKYDGQITRIGGLELPGARKPAAAPNDAENILIVGSDSRGDAKPGADFQGRGATFVTGQRSDTVILAHLYGGKSRKAQLVSFPRDSYVEIPAFTDPQTGRTRSARMGKLNSAINIGGPALLKATIEQLTDIRVDHYVQIDFEGFQKMVDKLDGVEVCLSKPAKEQKSGIDLPAGRQTIKGAQALAFVRQRNGLPGGDIDRIKRQQQFIASIVRKTLSARTLANPLKLSGVLDVATRSLVVDDGLGGGEMRKLALRFRNFSAGGVVFTTVPVEDPNRFINRESFVLLDATKAAALYAQIREDRPPDTPAPKPTAVPGGEPLVVAPGAVRVSVFNGGGVAGLGRRAAADLTEVGFQVVGIPENRGSGATGTVVFHGPDKADSARTLAAAIPGATVQLDPSLGRTLQVVVGSGYQGAVPVKVSGAPSGVPSPAATPRVITAQDDPCSI